ncbi:hypothetical protein ACLOJK_035323 [Asimina triloba]
MGTRFAVLHRGTEHQYGAPSSSPIQQPPASTHRPCQLRPSSPSAARSRCRQPATPPAAGPQPMANSSSSSDPMTVAPSARASNDAPSAPPTIADHNNARPAVPPDPAPPPKPTAAHPLSNPSSPTDDAATAATPSRPPRCQVVDNITLSHPDRRQRQSQHGPPRQHASTAVRPSAASDTPAPFKARCPTSESDLDHPNNEPLIETQLTPITWASQHLALPRHSSPPTAPKWGTIPHLPATKNNIRYILWQTQDMMYGI